VPFPVENAAAFSRLIFASEVLGSKPQAKFKWHIEAWQRRVAIHLGPGDIVNAVATLTDDLDDLAQPVLASIIGFQGAPRPVA
jgi:hypothetical protein